MSFCIFTHLFLYPFSFHQGFISSTLIRFVDAFISLVYAYDAYKNWKSKDHRKIFDILSILPIEIFSGLLPVNLMGGLRLLKALKIISLFKSFNHIKITVFPKYVKGIIIFLSSINAIHFISSGRILIDTQSKQFQTESYIDSVYWALTTLTTVGYGDITPQSYMGKIYTMLIMILGVGVYGLFIANIAVLLQADKYKKANNEKLSDMQTFMDYYQIPEDLQDQIINYYQKFFDRRLSHNDQQIMADLPGALQKDLRIHMNIKLIAPIPIFNRINDNCLKAIANSLKQEHFSPGQKIISIGDVGHEMYIIGHGTVKVVNKNGEVISTFQDGQFFGEVALIEERKRTADVFAESFTEVFVFDKKDFYHITALDMQLLRNIKKVMYQRRLDQSKSTNKSTKKVA